MNKNNLLAIICLVGAVILVVLFILLYLGMKYNIIRLN